MGGPTPRLWAHSLSPPIDISPILHTAKKIPEFSTKSSNFCGALLEGVTHLDVAMVEASLAKGSSDLRFLLTHHKVTDEVQAKLFENNVDTVAKFAAFVSDSTHLREVLKAGLDIGPP